tara:strand:- start:455 stop:694 length:240 start_codon:yes stop_codon:yes gene_type:complete
MDISLIENLDEMRLQPKSVHGMLWLQTHFETSQWDLLSSGIVAISFEDSKCLLHDAKAAGIQINYLPSESIARQISSLH